MALPNEHGLIVSVAVLVTPAMAVIVTGVTEATGDVVTENVAVVEAEATVTVGGAVAAASLVLNDTTTPSVGAAAERVTVPVEPAPPTRVPGDTATLVSVCP